MHVLSFVLIIAIATKIAVKMKQSHVMSSTLIGVTLMKVNMHVLFIRVGFSVGQYHYRGRKYRHQNSE